MPSGKGPTLGAALVDLFATEGRPGGARSTYTAKSWLAQFSQLSKTKTGYQAMEQAGVSASVRTQKSWLAGSTVAPGPTRAAIARAYAAMQGGFAARWKAARYEIAGRVTMGADSRERGSGRHAPLRVDGRAGNWTRIELAWNADAGPDEIERLFVEDVLIADLGETSHPWQFDGFWYEVHG